MSSVPNDYFRKKETYEGHIRQLRAAFQHPDKVSRIAKEAGLVKDSGLRFLRAEIGNLPPGLTADGNPAGDRLQRDLERMESLAVDRVIAWFRLCRRERLTASFVTQALCGLGDGETGED